MGRRRKEFIEKLPEELIMEAEAVCGGVQGADCFEARRPPKIVKDPDAPSWSDKPAMLRQVSKNPGATSELDSIIPPPDDRAYFPDEVLAESSVQGPATIKEQIEDYLAEAPRPETQDDRREFIQGYIARLGIEDEKAKYRFYVQVCTRAYKLSKEDEIQANDSDTLIGMVEDVANDMELPLKYQHFTDN